MRRIGLFGALFWFAGGVARAGVGVWTATPNAGAQTVVVGPDGSVYSDWGGAFSLEIARSTDHGATWLAFSGPGGVGLSFYQTSVLAVGLGNLIFAAFNAGGNAAFSARLYASPNEGEGWSLLSVGSTQYLELRIDPFSSERLFLHSGLPGIYPVPVVADGRLLRSTGFGVNWEEIDQTIISDMGAQRSVTAFALDSTTPGRLYAATVLDQFVPPPNRPPTLHASGNGGSTWTLLNASLPGVLDALVVDPFHASRIYGGGPSGIYRSDDEGETFVARSSLSTRQIVVDPLHEGRLYAATIVNGVLASTDGGMTWSALNSGLTNLAVNALTLDASAGYLYAATSTGVFAYQFPGPGTLVLDVAHPFTITLSATDQRTGHTGAGVATQVNDLWGYFSIPAITGNPNNLEVFVKMLDGTALNGSYWFFYGGLTDLEYTLTVTEDATGHQRTYTKPAGSECGGSDTAAFTP